jgi:hypothetical protein
VTGDKKRLIKILVGEHVSTEEKKSSILQFETYQNAD